MLATCDSGALPAETASHGLDGAQWLFERIHKGRYYRVDEWPPWAGIRSLGILFLQSTRLKLKEGRTY